MSVRLIIIVNHRQKSRIQTVVFFLMQLDTVVCYIVGILESHY